MVEPTLACPNNYTLIPGPFRLNFFPPNSKFELFLGYGKNDMKMNS